MDEHAPLQARICAAWIDLLRPNRGAEGRPDQYYALSVENVRGHGEEFELRLTFRAGRTYCCCEDMCHTGAFTKKRWRQVRAALAVHGIDPHKPLIVHICTRLEAGARLDHSKSGEPEVHDQGPWTRTEREDNAPMRKVFLLWHRRPIEEGLDEYDTDDKLIGVYSSAAAADEARMRKLLFEGFRDYPDCFHVDEYEVDKDAWSEGFVVVTTAG